MWLYIPKMVCRNPPIMSYLRKYLGLMPHCAIDITFTTTDLKKLMACPTGVFPKAVPPPEPIWPQPWFRLALLAT